MKSAIIERLGQTDILLPSLIQTGLEANDRVKVRLSVLQAAAAHARNPEAGRFDLTEECRSVGLDPLPMEALVHHASPLTGERMTAPGLDHLRQGIQDDVEAMIRAIGTAEPAAGEAAMQRLLALQAQTPPNMSDMLGFSQVGRLTGLSPQEDDSLHRLVMDLHKGLNTLSVAHAEGILAGAHVYGLLPEDRPAIEAFMEGLDTTRMLKFAHPGLATTAIRAGSRLTIQNDIGETDAHVVVIAIDQDAVTITYADNHLPRAQFFTRLFRDYPVQWSGLDRKPANGLDEGGVFYLVSGRYTTADRAARHKFLSALGAALVFLIDWNKARKVLRTWVSKNDAIDILEWASRNRIGHRGFLELGGSDLIGSAVHNAAATRIGFGERLDGALGREQAVDFLKAVLRVSAESLLEGSSLRLARDRIEADLIGRLRRVDSTLLAIVVRQAGLAQEIALGLKRVVTEWQAQRVADGAALAAQARRIEEKADRIAIDARNEIVRLDADRTIERLVNGIEEAIDELEQAAFIASLVPPTLPEELTAPLAELCTAALTGTEAAASGLTAAAEVPEGHRVDTEDALAAAGCLTEAEHAADKAERAVTTLVLRGDFDLRTALSVLELARAIERATDRMASFGHLLREHVLADLSK